MHPIVIIMKRIKLFLPTYSTVRQVTTLQPCSVVFTETPSTWYVPYDSQICLHWLRPATSEKPAYLTAHKQKHMHRHGCVTIHRRQAVQSTAKPLFCCSVLIINMSVGTEGTQGGRCRLCSQTKRLTFFFLWQCFVLEDGLSLSVDLCFPCGVLPCAVSLSAWIWNNKTTKPWGDTMIALQFSAIVWLISPRHLALREDELVTNRR